jgi:HAD superfamily hydrolase (TIGR01509 family)
MIQAAIFDIDGTLVDSVDLHALAWQEALAKFGHEVTFGRVRQQIGKGGDQLIPHFLSRADQKGHGEELSEWRGKHFTKKYLPLVRPFAAVPELLKRVRDEGLKVAIASSAKKKELGVLLDVARIEDLVDIVVSAEDVQRSKPAPDVFQVALKRLRMKPRRTLAIGDTPYDAEAAGKSKIRTIGFLSGGFARSKLMKAGCRAIYIGPAELLACFDASPLAKRRLAA